MNISPLKQVILLCVLALVFGVLNNFRPNAQIQWVRDWKDFSELAEKETVELPPPEDLAEETGAPLSDEEIMAAVTEQIGSNFQITDIGIKTAQNFHKYAKDFTLWIDARSPELYEEGHIEGALLCFINDKNSYLPDIEARIAELQPLALIVYCKGADCTDSHHLAEDLFAKGYENIFVYKDGFDHWHEAGLPIAGTLADAPAPSTSETTASVTPEPAAEKQGMYLEHVLRDMIPFVLGLVFLIGWKKSRRSKKVAVFSAIFVGLFFIWAAFPKVMQPFAFAKSIWNYDLLPGSLINLSALGMPMLELFAGLALIFWVFRKGGGLVTAGLLVLFILAVGFNMLRGHEFNCGCTSNKVYLTEMFLSGWNEKITLILRDIGLLVMSALTFLKPEWEE